jgi:3-oxoacyl-[acyl-carrier-protein] synthase II
MDDVVITGIDMITSLGDSALETWEALLSGKTGIKKINGFDVRGFDCQKAAQVRDFNHVEMNIHPRDARIMDKHTYMLLKCTVNAFQNSGLHNASIAGEEIGYFAGMGMVDYKIHDLLPSVIKSLSPTKGINYDAFFSYGYQEIFPLWPLSMLNNIGFCQVGITLGIKGENTVFSPYADSGLHAIGEAAYALLEGKVQVALAAGVSETVSPLSIARASLTGILNTSGMDVLCQPFCKNRMGTLLGEGCGVLTLELSSTAKKRGANCLAKIRGYGYAFGKGNGPFPSLDAISTSMQNAIKSAGLQPSDINVIIAHADGTVNGDLNEAMAIAHVFSNRKDDLHVTSTKGAFGNMFSGSPIIDTIIGIYMIKNDIIPTSLNSLPLDDKITFNVVADKPLNIKNQCILINALSPGGDCASLIIESV